MDQLQDLYRDDELDSEWARYVASLNADSSAHSRRIRERRKIERRERESMTHLQRHVRALSRARFELTADAAIELFDGDSSSDSDTGTVNVLDTPISRLDVELELDLGKLHDLDTDTDSEAQSDSESINLASSDSDSDAVPPTPTEPPRVRPKHKSAMPPISITHHNNHAHHHHTQHQKAQSTDGDDGDGGDTDPYNVAHAHCDFLSVHDSADSEIDINDSHSVLSANHSHDSHDIHASEPSESDDDSKSFKLSTASSRSVSTGSTKSPRPHAQGQPEPDLADAHMAEHMGLDLDVDIEYDAELEALKRELSHFQRRNRHNLRMRRTKSREEVLLSMLKINCSGLDGAELEQCTQSAIDKYHAAEWRSPSSAKSMTPIPELHPDRYLLESGQLSPVPVPVEPCTADSTDSPAEALPSMDTLQRERKQTARRLADPYGEEWNGLDPDDYMWHDPLPEGECYDDDELSLRDRRVQYLVVMAVENKYCDISDLTYSQNELLLMHQQSLVW